MLKILTGLCHEAAIFEKLAGFGKCQQRLFAINFFRFFYLIGFSDRGVGYDIALYSLQPSHQAAAFALKYGNYFLQCKRIGFTSFCGQCQQYLCSDFCIIDSSMKTGFCNLQSAGDTNQFVAGQRRHKYFGHIVGIQPGIWQNAPDMVFYHAAVKADIMCNQCKITDEIQNGSFYIVPMGLMLHHVVVNACELCNFFRYRTIRPNQL